MKKFATLAALCLAATFVGCQTTTDMSVSPAAVSECGVSCSDSCCMKACSADCAKDCCSKSDASYGALGEKSSDCSGKPSADCGGCPYASKKNDSM